MKIYRKLAIAELILAAVLLAVIPAGALAQCGGSGSGYSHDQHMGSNGHMGYGMHGQAPVQTDPNAVVPGYVVSAPDYSQQQDTSGYGSTGHGQMMGQGGMGSGNTGHMGH